MRTTRCASARARVGVWFAVLLLAAAVARPSPAGAEVLTVSDAAVRCGALAHRTIPSSAFALPTGQATVEEAVLIPADAAIGLPEYCRARGEIAGAKLGDLPIRFQLNLPSQWNLKTVQYGGAGLNGVLIEATGPFVGGGGPVAPALASGYVTYGSDSGHPKPDRSFLTNPQAFANYAHEGIKRARDLSGALVKTYYGRDARRNYFIGGSKGGQEGLQAVQRYPADFDGVVAYYPAAQIGSLQLGWNRLWHFAFDLPGGALDTAHQALLKRSVLAACDRLDGAADGIVSDTALCERTFKVADLRCPDGKAGEACLSDAQIAALEAAARPFTFAYPMPHGVTSIGPWPALIGGDLKLWLGDGVDGTEQAFYRQAAARPEALRTSGIDAQLWRRDVDQTAQIYDASNPDIDAFRAKGGKLIMLHGTTDMLVPEAMSTHYYEALTARYGRPALRSFVRYYVAPGYGHGEGVFKVQWDALAALDAWVEAGRAPEGPVATDGSAEGKGRTRPICEYPTWPKYLGHGDVNRASNFACARD